MSADEAYVVEKNPRHCKVFVYGKSCDVWSVVQTKPRRVVISLHFSQEIAEGFRDFMDSANGNLIQMFPDFVEYLKSVGENS